ncbi:uncharacterized protein H6S33_005794 [Morchella sextelata]|uniref:uncharacterized protein n=1 Tax=Morchella sextelata TaxID=1174677 RepID=UPI001D038B2D|nr:uncharacterized protein H6S33_005794 [Morchella sextelata]KAH0613908.1 hypothetical protein H6S33_005794 [Morchella sextelata]
MPFNLVCPSSRGLSLALSRRLLQTSPYPLVATARKDTDAVKSSILEGLNVDDSRVTVLKVDITDESLLSDAASEISKRFPEDHIQYAFSTCGILHPERSPADLKKELITETLHTNILGPLLVLKHFSPFLPTKKTSSDSDAPSVWSNMAARVGSTADNRLGGWYSYRATKAGVNSITKTFDIHLSRVSGDKAFCVSLHPGTVKTELSREFWGSVNNDKLFSPERAAERLVGVVSGLKLDQRGLFWDWEGKKIEW